MRSNPAFSALASTAVRCRECFRDLPIAPALIDVAQPRWVGPGYESSRPRVLIILLNPGSGAYRRDSANACLRDLLHAFLKGRGSLDAVLQHQAEDISNWGNGRFARFYLEGLGLSLQQVALANIAWCATSENQYPPTMLKRCFDRHTRQLLLVLQPDIVLLSGRATHCFMDDVQRALPSATIIPILHYAHRAGREAGDAELHSVREALGRASTVKS